MRTPCALFLYAASRYNGVMYKEGVLFFLGVAVFCMPFYGLPLAFVEPVQFGAGVCMLLLALAYRLERRRTMRDESELLHAEHDPHAHA